MGRVNKAKVTVPLTAIGTARLLGVWASLPELWAKFCAAAQSLGGFGDGYR
jgi:hypothetical protein